MEQTCEKCKNVYTRVSGCPYCTHCNVISPTHPGQSTASKALQEAYAKRMWGIRSNGD